jgi:hypothetical protein
VINAQQKTMLKAGIVQLMLTSTENVRAVLMEVVTIMAAYDWPASWPDLLPVCTKTHTVVQRTLTFAS